MAFSKLKFVVFMFAVLWLCLFISIYLTSGALMNSANCNDEEDSPSQQPPAALPSLSEKGFIEEYLSLPDTVRHHGPGEGIMTSLFNYLSAGKSELEEPPQTKLRKNVLIGVVTTEKYLLTRASAIHNTWAQDLGPRNEMYFFVGEDCKTDHPLVKDMSIIKLKGVPDDVYPPQKKVFAVLEYMHAEFGGDFRWFIRADDDVYIRMDKLEIMLDDWEWTEKLELGHPGYGLKEDRLRLKLLPHETYCMGGPGVVLSAPALTALAPNLNKCLKAVEFYNQKGDRDIGWFNEDVELGRCVSRTVGIGCSPVAKVGQFLGYPIYIAYCCRDVLLSCTNHCLCTRT